MDGRDDGPFEGALVTQPRLAFAALSRVQQRVDLFANPLAHFVRGAVGERDGYDVVDGNFFGAQNFEIALDQHKRFARSRAGSDREMTVEGVRGRGLFRL